MNALYRRTFRAVRKFITSFCGPVVILALIGLAPANADMIAAWGYDGQGQVSNAPTGAGFTAIAGGDFNGYALQAQVVPEPSSIVMLGMGAVGIMGYGWRKRKQARA
jgi:hypothetical protein